MRLIKMVIVQHNSTNKIVNTKMLGYDLLLCLNDSTHFSKILNDDRLYLELSDTHNQPCEHNRGL